MHACSLHTNFVSDNFWTHWQFKVHLLQAEISEGCVCRFSKTHRLVRRKIPQHWAPLSPFQCSHNTGCHFHSKWCGGVVGNSGTAGKLWRQPWEGVTGNVMESAAEIGYAEDKCSEKYVQQFHRDCLFWDFDSSRILAEVWMWKHSKPGIWWDLCIEKEKPYHQISHENLQLL